MQIRSLAAALLLTALFVAPARAATISYQASFSNTCAFCTGSSTATGSFTQTWDDTTFSANYTISYTGLGSTLQSIRFYDTQTGANYNGQIGPFFPELGEEQTGSQSGSQAWFSTYHALVTAGTLGIGLTTLSGSGFEIGGTISVAPEPQSLGLFAAALAAAHLARRRAAR